MSNKVRTRYAPSPTGFFHIGGARTALFNYVFAKHFNGTFILRIEDTDVERNVVGGIESQIDNLEWLKIIPDESVKHGGLFPPYVQTQKLSRYQELAKKLVNEGKAYYCFCTKEQLQKQRDEALTQGLTPKYNRQCLQLSSTEVQQKLKDGTPAAIRLKIKDNVEIKWDDLIRGKMNVPTSALTDPVILKSNGIPMYNFAVVVDDYDMQITHVLRGEEHISNTPYQIAIKEALGFDKQPIEYGHLSIIVDDTGKKLSKRNKELKQFIEDYKTMGFLPEAITNFLALLGWTSKDNKEIMAMSELIKNFDSKRLSKAPAFFDLKKMLWIGNAYIKTMSDDEYLKFVKTFITFDVSKLGNALDQALLIFKPQIAYGQQINELVTKTFLSDDFNNVPREIINNIKTKEFWKNFDSLEIVLFNVNKITLDNANDIVNQVKLHTGLSGKTLYSPIRFVAIGQEHGPEMNKILAIVGKEKMLNNIKVIRSKFHI